jgi:hypothetical protein
MAGQEESREQRAESKRAESGGVRGYLADVTESQVGLLLLEDGPCGT